MLQSESFHLGLRLWNLAERDVANACTMKDACGFSVAQTPGLQHYTELLWCDTALLRADDVNTRPAIT